ncbi:MAG TPA: dienelactone hydrolase family protein [Chloroflexota bacterium]|jgi:dienelactone hydrolase
MTGTACAEGIGIRIGGVVLEANLAIPKNARSVVLFAHGSGSSRSSPRNRAVASALNDAGMATLLVDLLTAEEDAIDRITARLRFNIALLTQRLVGATDWLQQAPETGRLHIGYFGASTGAAAAFLAVVERPEVVGAIVSRGGRPDLVGPVLRYVRAPSLLIVGGNDTDILGLSCRALAKLPSQSRLEIVPGATHLFEEPGALDAVARLAAGWFGRHL